MCRMTKSQFLYIVTFCDLTQRYGMRIGSHTVSLSMRSLIIEYLNHVYEKISPKFVY